MSGPRPGPWVPTEPAQGQWAPPEPGQEQWAPAGPGQQWVPPDRGSPVPPEQGTRVFPPSVLVEQRDDRLVVRLSRPAVRNAVNAEMVDRLHEVCTSLEQRPRLLLITGTDGVFAAGADVAELRQRGRQEALAGINSTLFERIHRLPLPTVAAVDGPALGGGAELAYACDLRVASTRARFANPEPNLGIIAGAGGCWRLRELVGEGLAKEMLLAGRQLDADEALAARLVCAVVEPEALLDAAHGLLDRMASFSPSALRLTKLALDAGPGAHPAVDHLAQALLFEGEDKRERMTAFLERRDGGV